jgi:O-glycosyl hydrolase
MLGVLVIMFIVTVAAIIYAVEKRRVVSAVEVEVAEIKAEIEGFGAFAGTEVRDAVARIERVI